MSSSNARPLVHLDPLRGTLFLHTGARITALGPSGFAEVPALEKTLPKGWSVEIMFGVWPTSAYAQLNPTERTGDQTRALYRVSERGMRRLHDVTPYTDYVGAWYGAAGQVGAVAYVDIYGSIATWIELLSGAKVGIPALQKREDKEPRLALYNMAAFPSGHLVLFGVDRMAPNQQLWPAIEYWAPGAQSGTFVTLPTKPGYDGAPEASLMSAPSPTQVWVTGLASRALDHEHTTYLAHWDGERWTVVDMPATIAPRTITRIVATVEGELWFACNGTSESELLHRALDGSWSRVPLPAPPPGFPPAPRAFLELLMHEGEIWMSVASRDGSGRFAVYRTRPSPGVFTLDAPSP